MKLRIIYALHMILPLSLVELHLSMLDSSTLQRLRALFGAH